jgi:hypothetical protein
MTLTERHKEAIMSLLHNTDVYQSPKETADHKESDFWVWFALLCAVALALVAANAVAAPASIDNGISTESLAVSP